MTSDSHLKKKEKKLSLPNKIYVLHHQNIVDGVYHAVTRTGTTAEPGNTW
jgi:hypothetical protein